MRQRDQQPAPRAGGHWPTGSQDQPAAAPDKSVSRPLSRFDSQATTLSQDRNTIFALSSGRPPAAIAVIRISGPGARLGLVAACGRVPEPRRATLARLRDPVSHELIDEALVLWFPGPGSETGEA